MVTTPVDESTVVITLPVGVKMRSALNGTKSLGKPNDGDVPEGLLLSALTRKPVPGVENVMPRARPPGVVWLKKSPGNRFGSEEPSGTPSQLISRRPPLKLNPLLGFRAPSAAR